MKNLYIKFFVLVPLLLLGLNSKARKNPTEGKSAKGSTTVVAKAEGCGPATTTEIMKFNNVRALIETGGSLWQDRSTSNASYIVPKNQNVAVLYAGALWMGGKSPDQQLKLAAVRYRSRGDDFWPGPLTENTAEVSQETCLAYDKFFVTYKLDAKLHRAWAEFAFGNAEEGPEGYVTPAYFEDYPAMGDVAIGQSRFLAPFYDFDGDGFYDPESGDYPKYDVADEFDCRTRGRFEEVPLFGDENYFWIFNDKGNIHTETSGDPIGMEIRAQAFSFATTDEINNMTFYNYTLINQGTQTLTQTYFGQYADPDVGAANNDYVGCDVARGLGYCYNGTDFDATSGGVTGWGANPPAVGIDFFEGPYQDADGIDNPNAPDIAIALDSAGIPYGGLGIGYGDGVIDNERYGMRKFIYYNISGDPGTVDPQVAPEYYNYMTGFWKDGAPLTFGGDGHSNNSGVPCDYMFPGDSDPLRWGTHGADAGSDNWSEVSEGTNPEDRRFIQSAGPFTLEPGQWNNITVGVVYGRALSGNSFESVKQVLIADDKAQSLFDNCFETVPGPDAPILTITELENKLVLQLTNTSTISNNTNEIEYDQKLTGFDPGIPPVTSTGEELTDEDRSYKFQGYKIFQLADESVSAGDLDKEDKARLIFQCDIKDDVSDIFNFEINPDAPTIINGKLEVSGSNDGIKHSFEVTTDAFATGSPFLVNYKSYYFMAIAYAYNNYEDFQYGNNETDATGQDIQYLASQKSAFGGTIPAVVGIPHKQADLGTSDMTYGDGIKITQIEGAGNGKNIIDISKETEDKILEDNFVEELTFEPGRGPVNIKIVDPLRVQDIDFELRLLPYDGDEEYDDDSTYWVLMDLTNNKEVDVFKRAFKYENEYILEDYGLSMDFSYYKFYDPDYSNTANKKSTDFLEGNVVVADPTKVWYAGIQDQEGFSEINWLRIGNFEAGENADASETYYNDYPLYGSAMKDTYEKVIGGTWGPFYHTTKTDIDVTEEFSQPGAEIAFIGPRNEANFWNLSPSQTNDMIFTIGLNNVDVVFTSDKSKWTRSPVLEMQVYEQLAQGNAKKLFLRNHLSVDKNGKVAGQSGYNAEEGDLTGPTGMGWFPGYAIDVGTGERLNIAFGEDSWNEEDNGDDMLWNPNSITDGPLFRVRAAGQHWIYIFKNGEHEQGMGGLVPRYDEGKFIHDILIDPGASTGEKLSVFSSCTWTGSGLLTPQAELLSVEDGLIPQETRVRLRVAKKYKKFSSTQVDFNDVTNSQNNWDPLYRFSTKSGMTITEEAGVTQETLNDKILECIQVVPNPYYAYSEYETSKLDNRIKFTNLPQECTITIYNVSGTLIRQYKKADPLSYLDWDLKNSTNIPISSGVYIIHFEIPDVGEKVLKWFGVMRPVDLDNF